MRKNLKNITALLLALVSLGLSSCTFDSVPQDSDNGDTSLNSDVSSESENVSSESFNNDSSEDLSSENISQENSESSSEESETVISISSKQKTIHIGETLNIEVETNNPSIKDLINLKTIDFDGCLLIDGLSVIGEAEGSAKISAYYKDTISNFLNITVLPFDKDGFYAKYSCSASFEDATFRTKNNLMSGELEVPHQAATIASDRPKSGLSYIKNNVNNYSDNNQTYNVVDSNGNNAFSIYKGGAYITLEEVAAYVYAFGDVPANYTKSKDGNPAKNPWGEYYRLNFTFFNYNQSKYPYEPVFPDIVGMGNGNLRYYEIDIGTLGTDCNPKYPAKIYNDGNTITRGAARIVFSKEYSNGEQITDLNDRHVFYTYNHYNDFVEYLNYENGWGEMFGNITGGGKLSSKTDYKPTAYPEVVLAPLTY